jgi:serine/threonine protein kinase
VIGERLGKGTFGVVVEAKDLRTNAVVVIKLMAKDSEAACCLACGHACTAPPLPWPASLHLLAVGYSHSTTIFNHHKSLMAFIVVPCVCRARQIHEIRADELAQAGRACPHHPLH